MILRILQDTKKLRNSLEGGMGKLRQIAKWPSHLQLDNKSKGLIFPNQGHLGVKSSHIPDLAGADLPGSGPSLVTFFESETDQRMTLISSL